MNHISLRWDDSEKALLIASFEGVWTWEIFHQTVSEITEMMGTVDHLVDLIVDFRKSAGYPSGNLILQLRATAKKIKEAPNFGGFALAGGSMFFRSISDITGRLRGRSGTHRAFAITRDLEEARSTLKKNRDARVLAYNTLVSNGTISPTSIRQR